MTWVDGLNKTFERFNITTPRQQAMFIGQCGHECANFKILEENLNYKAATLMRLWDKRFPTQEIANQYAGNPKKIANMVYANRMGNRDEASGDGFRFRGGDAFSLPATQIIITRDKLSDSISSCNPNSSPPQNTQP